MRISQFAKKYGIPAQDIVNFLKDATGEKFHPNAKLYDTLESQVYDHFNPQLQELETEETESVEEPVEASMEEHDIQESIPEESNDEEAAPDPAPAIPDTPEDDIALGGGDLGFLEDLPKPVEPVDEQHTETEEEESAEETTEEVKPQPAEDEIIQTDKLLEMLESEEAPADLEKIKLIKAPKKELSGLKVVGKIDLPEPRKKEEVKPEDKEIVTEKDLREYRNPRRKKKAPLTEEEKEKRRLRAKKKKEEYEARQEKRKKEQEAKKLKELKAAHYQQKLQKPVPEERPTPQKPGEKPRPVASRKKKETRPKPRTVFGKFWRWLNPEE